jgi:hypothetical protein
MRRLPRSWLAAFWLLVLAGSAVGQQGAGAPSSPPLSPAEQALFQEAHLKDLRPPVQLQYEFERRSAVAGDPVAPFRDQVSLQFGARPDGSCCTTQGQFLSGPRAMALPDIEAATSNPVTLFFLEREVRELQRATGGQAAHFRRRIRLALADGAQVSATTVRHGGRELPATLIRITPYADDPVRARFAAYAATQYQFILCSQVPGGVFSLQTTVPGAGGDNQPGRPPRSEETLSLLPSSPG